MCISCSSAEVIIKSLSQLNIPAFNSFCTCIVILPISTVETNKIIRLCTEIMGRECCLVINACVKANFFGFALFRVQLFTAIERIVQLIHIRSAEEFLVRYVHVGHVVKFIGKYTTACSFVAIFGMLRKTYTGSKAPITELHLVLDKECLIINSTGHARCVLIVIFIHGIFIIIITTDDSMIAILISQLF